MGLRKDEDLRFRQARHADRNIDKLLSRVTIAIQGYSANDEGRLNIYMKRFV